VDTTIRNRASSVARALNIVGDRWTMLIMRDLFLGVTRFDEWRRRLGIPRQRLADRLRRLVAAGVLRKQPYTSRPVRHEYRLTAMGRDFYRVAVMIRRWEDRWLPARRRWVEMTHQTCGAVVLPLCVCAQCGGEVEARALSYEDGPGAGRDQRVPARIGRRTTGAATCIVGVPFVEPTVEILGDRWTYQVLGCAFSRLRRFDAIRRELGIATNILADRLRRLQDEGILQRTPNGTGAHEYRLTAKGRDFFPVVLALMNWGDLWLAGGKGPPLLLRHLKCGARLIPRFICAGCRSDLKPAQVSYRLASHLRSGRGGVCAKLPNTIVKSSKSLSLPGRTI
jgi:DNA-binding HxlR family transcriptional regulator